MNSKKVTISYNIHDIIKINLEWDKYYSVIRDLDLKFKYFQVDRVDNPDISIKIGKFEPDVRHCKVFERKYYVRDNFIFCRGGDLKSKWSFQINGLNTNKLFMNVDSRFFSLRGFIAPNFFVHLLLLSLLEQKLLEKNYLVLHSASVSKEGNSYLITGRGGSLKTSICMDLIRHKDYNYMSDDRSLVHKKMLFSFPTHLDIFSHMISKLKDERMTFFDRILLFYLLKYSKDIKKINITDKNKLTGIIFLSPSSRGYQKRQISEDSAIVKMSSNMNLELFEIMKIIGIDYSPILGCFQAYNSIYPSTSINRNYLFESNLRETLKDLPIYDVFIPKNYNKVTSNYIHNILKIIS